MTSQPIITLNLIQTIKGTKFGPRIPNPNTLRMNNHKDSIFVCLALGLKILDSDPTLMPAEVFEAIKSSQTEEINYYLSPIL